MTKILVVDDNESNRYLLEAMLGAAGFRVTAVNHGAAALELARREPPDGVISDILMPVMDGFTLCKEWRRAADLRDIPFLFYTATYTDPKDEEFALSLGADAFLVKPQEPESFIREVRQLLEKHTHGQLSRQAPAGAAEQVFLKQYNQSLVRKLEDKLVQLEELNRALQRELAGRQVAEREVRRLNQDLEERVCQRTRELALANRELEAFSYSVSHDLRTPLRHIASFAKILAEDPASTFSESARRSIEVIERSTRRMDQLIEGLLNLAQNDTKALKFTRVLTQELVHKVRQDLAAMETGRQVRWRIHPLPEIQGDEALLGQVWVNLMDNALKYTRNQPIAELEIGALVDSHTGEVEYFIRDNGVGFDMEYVSRLFGVFQRLHPESEFEGVGIGLANVRRIIERHGGRIWAESLPGRGAIFSFRLPTQPNPSVAGMAAEVGPASRESEQRPEAGAPGGDSPSARPAGSRLLPDR